MEVNKFEALLSIITGDLVVKIMDETGESDDEAIARLYNSKLYSFLEQEDTKVWQYSTPMLYDMLDAEIKTGELEFPE